MPSALKSISSHVSSTRPHVVSFANAYAGYLPSKRAQEWGWCAHDDSYKWQDKPANWSGGIEDALLKVARQLMAE